MNMRGVVLGCTGLLLALPLLARDKTDVVVMENGDRLTGEVKGLKAGVLYLSLDYVDGTIALQWSKVARLESRQLFLVETEDGGRYTGTPTTQGTSGGGSVRIQIAENAGRHVSFERSSIVVLSETSDRFWQRFDGEVIAGVTQSKGDNFLQFNLGSQLAYRRERWATTADFASSLSSSSGSNSSTRNQFTQSAYHLLGDNHYFYGGLATIGQSSVERIAERSGVGAGLGRFLKNTNHARISLLAGLIWLNSDYSSPTLPIPTQNVAASLFVADISLFEFKKTNFSTRTSLFQGISQPHRGRVFLNTNVYYYIKIANRLYWNVSFYGNWDSAPPANFSGSDYGTSSGLSWTFGTR